MIVPISLESDVGVIGKQLEMALKVEAERFHVDIIDGLYADNLTVAPADLQAINFGGIELDLHLLVDDPTEWIPECVALRPARIFAQIEKMGNIEHYLEVMKEHGEVKACIGVGLHTPIDSLEDGVLSGVDGVLLMAIEPGFGGSPFHPEVLPKIKELRKRYKGEIFVDGGMNPTTYALVKRNGASEAGANSALWRGDFEKNWKLFEGVK